MYCCKLRPIHCSTNTNIECLGTVLQINVSVFLLQLRKEDDESVVTKDWKFAAMVVDRLCLIIFTLFTLIATLAVLFSAPNFLLS